MTCIPTLTQARDLLAEAESLNPGPWIAHSQYTGQAAGRIAARTPGLDAQTAEVFGLLHDIARRFGVSDMRHAIDGYHFLTDLGWPEPARICLTHSFPVQDPDLIISSWDCSQEAYEFASQYLRSITYTPYDRLIQLCDALALPNGFCLIEKRLVDVAVRYGLRRPRIEERWRATFAIQKEFEDLIGCSLYELLPGVVENTFGFDPRTN